MVRRQEPVMAVSKPQLDSTALMESHGNESSPIESPVSSSGSVHPESPFSAHSPTTRLPLSTNKDKMEHEKSNKRLQRNKKSTNSHVQQQSESKHLANSRSKKYSTPEMTTKKSNEESEANVEARKCK